MIWQNGERSLRSVGCFRRFRISSRSCDHEMSMLTALWNYVNSQSLLMHAYWCEKGGHMHGGLVRTPLHHCVRLVFCSFLLEKKQRTLTLSSFRVMHLSSVLRTSQICHVFSWSIFLLVGTWVDPSTYQPCRPTFRMLELSTPSYLLSTPSSSGCWQISCKRFLPANCYLSMNSSKEPNLGIRFEENIHVQCGPLTLVAVVTSGVPDVTKFF